VRARDQITLCKCNLWLNFNICFPKSMDVVSAGSAMELNSCWKNTKSNSCVLRVLTEHKEQHKSSTHI